MKTPLFALALAFSMLAISATSQAQNQGKRPKNPEEMAARQTENLATQLSLSEEQKAQVLEINTRFAKEAVSLRDQNQGNREAMMDLFKRQGDEMKTVLNEEQYAQFLKIRKENAQKMKGRRGGQAQAGQGSEY